MKAVCEWETNHVTTQPCPCKFGLFEVWSPSIPLTHDSSSFVLSIVIPFRCLIISQEERAKLQHCMQWRNTKMPNSDPGLRNKMVRNMFVGSMCAGSMFRKIVKIDVHPNLEIYVYKQQMIWKQMVVAFFSFERWPAETSTKTSLASQGARRMKAGDRIVRTGLNPMAKL